jgi:hypothetical protein
MSTTHNYAANKPLIDIVGTMLPAVVDPVKSINAVVNMSLHETYAALHDNSSSSDAEYAES